MSKMKELTQREADLIKEARALLDGPETESGMARYDAIQQELDKVAVSKAREKKQLDRERALEAVTDGNEDDAEAAADRNGGQDPRLFGHLGEQLQAVMLAGMGRGVDARLRKVDPAAAATGMNESVPAEGGYAVQKDFGQMLVDRMYAVGELLARVDKLKIGANSNGTKLFGPDESSRATGSRWGGIRGYWKGEGAALAASQPKFRVIELDLKKLTGLMYATDELIKDATALASVALKFVPLELTFLMELALVSGSGAGEPLGYLNGPGSVEVAKAGGQVADTIVSQNVIDMWARMPAWCRKNAIWTASQDAEAVLPLMTIGGTAAIPIWQPPGRFADQPLSTLYGRPVVTTEYNAKLGDSADLHLIDLTQYAMIEKEGIEMASSIHVRFLEDEQVFRFIVRTDGQPFWHKPLTPYNAGATQSPFLYLAERA